MSIMMVTSLTSYTKSMAMKMKWQKKQAEGDYSPDRLTSAENTSDKRTDEIRYPKSDRSSRMEADIELKLNSGKKLTAEEMQYLKEHNPETYQKAKNIERERESYEKELASCKTKEEVEMVKASHAAAAVDQVNSIKNNPNISGGKKLELIKAEYFKAAARDDAMHLFTQSSDYKKLPSEAERQKAEKDMEEAKKTELGLDEESQKEKAAEKAAGYEPEKTEEEVEKKIALLEESKKKIALPEESADNAGKEGTIVKALQDAEAAWKEEERRSNDSDSDKITRTQAEATPEARKVRQAKARAAYASSQPSVFFEDTPTIDIKK